MAGKRQRIKLEPPVATEAALPAVCYLPGVLTDGAQPSNAPSTSAAAATRSPAKRLKYSVHRSSKSLHHHLVHASLGNIEYVGRSDGAENAGVAAASYALGVYNPDTGKLQLVHVAGERPFRLDTRLEGLVYAPTGAGADEEQDRDARKMAAKRLVDEFGSTRRRRQLNAREAGVVAADRISGGEAVQQVLGSVAARGQGEGLTREEMRRRAFSARTVPPHNPNATSAAAAYPLELLLGPPAAAAGEEEVEGEREAAARALVGELYVRQIQEVAEDEKKLEFAREKDVIPSYVLSRLGPLRLLKASDSESAASRVRRRVQYLALLAALLRLQARPRLAIKSEGVAGVAREMRLREALMQHLLDKFYNRVEDPLRGARYERTDAQSALLLAYIVAVAVVAEEGYMEAEQVHALRETLK
ncbi:hypothetical protein Agub_g9790, partial [Astrephomene gubernaculifera]